ncbi:MAG TPA: pyruvate, phosphate dikinase [Armatimonadota bacterium]|jgi:pyruvate,orthophosphate dikinase
MSSLKHVYLSNTDVEPIKAALAAQGRELRDFLGGKGSNLFIMTSEGLPVPPDFTVTTDACNEYVAAGNKFPAGLEDEILAAMVELEKITGKEFGNPANPLLVSVRSGAKFSMPGMMDTVLNLGLNDAVAEGMIALTGNERFVWDAYRRFVMMFGDVVMGVKRHYFEEALDEVKAAEGVKLDVEVSAAGLKKVVELEKAVYEKHLGEAFPQDPSKQLIQGVRAVFDSWNNDRAIAYRQLNKIAHSLGTAVNVQTMVFGNMGDDSGTGVAFTRDPSTGEKALYGDFLLNAQGEDVVAGIRTPEHISHLQDLMPAIYDQFVGICNLLENLYHNMQDLEFTIEKGTLYMLQCRNGKRTAQAAVKIAVDMVDEGLITKQEAVMMVEPSQLDQLLHRQFDAKQKPASITKGVAASPGAAAGKVVFTAAEAVAMAEKGERVVLVRKETSPDDIRGMHASQGILTSMGGKTSHAAVVGRQMGKPCVVGCNAVEIAADGTQMNIKGNLIKAGDFLSIDGATGEVMLGDVPTTDSEIILAMRGDIAPADAPMAALFARFMPWADEIRVLGVRTNADTPEDSALAVALGAGGIGLTRTEHMFFGEQRLLTFQKMILSENVEERQAAADELLPYQREDFYGILKEMNGRPVIIRLLDPPLHEFLPKDPAGVKAASEISGKSEQEVMDISESLHEFNPMLGHRGCRLGITFPEIYKMQVRAIFQAACQLKKEGLQPIPEVMIPLVSLIGELEITSKDAKQVAKEVMAAEGVEFEYMLGTMIELPRAALIAGDIAKEAEFFSFGTNDLTQTTFGFSRDDVEGKFIPAYISQGIIQVSPFESLDEQGVGRLVSIACSEGRAVRPELELGICGEHGGDPDSVDFCHRVGLDYVSCSPLRVPIARLAAAQAQVKNPR